MHHGSCLCGTIRYAITGDISHVSRCHCRMCQKQHAAEFATYVSIKRGQFRYTHGEDALTAFNSSSTIERRFCKHCGSTMEWSGSPQFPDWISIPLATFDSDFQPEHIEDVHLESRRAYYLAHH